MTKKSDKKPNGFVGIIHYQRVNSTARYFRLIHCAVIDYNKDTILQAVKREWTLYKAAGLEAGAQGQMNAKRVD